ncbi:MAG: TIGR00303 family protein [Cyanobacteriota bacterium]|nr:TIGR00303 family protein [Cyanobacteriota bacterium]
MKILAQTDALNVSLVKAYTGIPEATAWCDRIRGLSPCFICGFAFTETALIPGISAAGASPLARRFTALADAEVLLQGFSPRLPTSPDGYPSPVVISRAILSQLDWSTYLFDCGLPESLTGLIRVSEQSGSRCLSTGQAMDRSTVQHLFQQGKEWGQALASRDSYCVIGECVAGGTTTALAVLLGLGWSVAGMVNSSHPICNHEQKWALVQEGLRHLPPQADPWQVLAAVGDPMQAFVAGFALQASQHNPVLLAGGTQMLAVVAIMQRLARDMDISWQPQNMVVGTTRWVAEDPTGQTVRLAELLGEVPLLATQLSFASSRFAPLQAYERGYVKEGVGAGGLSLAASLSAGWQQEDLLTAIEGVYEQWLSYGRSRDP